MNEIKATAATWEDLKRLSEENERLEKKLFCAVSLLSIDKYIRYVNASKRIDKQIGDLKDE